MPVGDDYIREKEVRTLDDETLLQKSVDAVEDEIGEAKARKPSPAGS